MLKTSRVNPVLAGNVEAPLVTCIMPTANRRAYVPLAIERFLEQDYANRELLILDDGEDKINDLVPQDDRVRYLALPERLTVGAKRNIGCQEARGELIAHWDDDDWCASWRLRYQVEELLRHQADLCGLSSLYFWQPSSRDAWLYVFPAAEQAWVAGGTLCYRKEFWKSAPFSEIQVGEDNLFVWSGQPKRLLALTDSRFYVATVHGHNTSPKQILPDRWIPIDEQEIQETMQEDYAVYQGLHPVSVKPAAAPRQQKTRPAALVAAAQGIGDIIRMTPMVRILDQLGYDTDLLLEPDFTGIVELLAGAPEVRRLYYRASKWNRNQTSRLEGFERQKYALAVFSCQAQPLVDLVQADRMLGVDPDEWLRHGDSACLAAMAAELGWTGAIPPPFVSPSGRRFGLPEGTVAIHPGCKKNWPWKKWHDFDELARLLPSVAIVGAASDLENDGTYFDRPFAWPAHAQNFVGQLSLPDTAALLSQCRALVSNDSGMMHIGTALGIPTLGIFGITNPAREAIPSPNLFPVTKQLSCEPACREKEWGRSNCEFQLECLRTLTAKEVLQSLDRVAPAAKLSSGVGPRTAQDTSAIKVVYCGPYLEMSGYGTAARAYIHALVAAGVQVMPVAATQPPNPSRIVRDPVIDALDQSMDSPDFQIFHGIPPQWPELSCSAPAIGVTVWETDAIPGSWQASMGRVADLWLPSQFNCDVFSQGSSLPIFRWPHIAPQGLEAELTLQREFPGIEKSDFVYYSIFEWQERKAPVETMLTFLDAFREAGHAVLFLKTNPEAAEVAEEAVRLAKKEVGSRARVIVKAEYWSDEKIRALHRRGDCYVSLHRGEGWGYPLFEAACMGKAILATAYSGPLDYLHPDHHALVRASLGPVRQSYHYYEAGMQWAEPDWRMATDRMRRIFDERKSPKVGAEEYARALRARFAPEAVGNMAKARMEKLRSRINTRSASYAAAPATAIECPPTPIPAEWFDADYFDHGKKSNWAQGYNAETVGIVMAQTAAMICDLFPHAATFLDAGCARGFLVRVLREAGKQCWGFDHSPWAIQTADEKARPFLSQNCTNSFSPDRSYDVVLAFDLLAQLTEAQALDFLRNARSWTRGCLLATIPSPEGGHRTKPNFVGSQDEGRDRSHITMRTRAWWRDLFAQAGWRQQFAATAAERACQAHPLVAAMGWNVYLYCP